MSKIKILIVDDEPDFLELISLRIESWGYAVTKASEGSEAIEAVKKNAPDIMVLDYMMPGMDGIETLRIIRKSGSDIPVIMFTAYPNTNTMEGASQLGISAFIPKLSAYSEVLPALKTALALAEKKIENKGR